MILGHIEQSACYDFLGPRFAQAFAYLRAFRPEDFCAGRQELDAQKLFVIHAVYDTRDEQTAQMEAHRRYADIMLMVEGAEVIAWKPTLQLQHETAPYAAENEASLAKIDADVSRLVLNEGCFAVFLPEDAHAPELHFGAAAHVKKLIVKVLLD